MGKLALLFTCAILILVLSACGNNHDVSPDIPSEQESSSVSDFAEAPSLPDMADEPTEEPMEDPTEEPATTIDIILTVDDTVITATLDNSETTSEFLSTLPRTLTMNRYGDREYYGRIESISENGESIPDFENGDVTYYPAGPSFAIFFDGEDRSNQAGLIRMGKTTSDLSVFEELGDSVELQIELE